MIMKLKPYKGIFKKGDRIIVWNHDNTSPAFRGVVHKVDSYIRINVKRDDKSTGGGSRIAGYGSSWLIERFGVGDEWKDDGRIVTLERITSWKEIMMPVMKEVKKHVVAKKVVVSRKAR